MKTKGRITWIDTVKGIAILLVVLHHATQWALDKDWSGHQLSYLTDALATVRMPLFFAMSGFFFLSRVDRLWDWQIRNRVGPFLWLYALWSAVWVLAFAVIPWQRQDVYEIGDLPKFLVDPAIGPWYIYALAFYFVGVKLLRPLPTWGQLVVGCCISLPFACGLVSFDSWAWESVLSYFITFQIGVLGSRVITVVADSASLSRLLVYGAIWAGISGILYVGFHGFANIGRIPLTLVGMAMGITAASLLDRHAPWLRLAWFGRNTLPIYVLHIPMLGLIYSLDVGLPEGSVLVQVGMPIVVAAGAVAGALLVWRVLRPIPGLFIAPWTGEGANTRTAKKSPAPVQAGSGRRDGEQLDAASPRWSPESG